MDNEQLNNENVEEPVRIDPVTGKKDEFVIDDDFSYSGYQITREEFFAHSREPSLTICGNKLYLNKVCFRKAPDTLRIQVLVNEEEKKIVIKPCAEEKKDSVQWVTAKGSMRKILCKPAFCVQITEVTGWNLNNRHKMIGKLIRNNGERLFMFDMASALIYPGKQELDEEGNVIKSSFSRNPVYTESWEHQFGLPVEEHERRYSINRFDGFVTISVQDHAPRTKPRPTLDREELQ